MTRIDALVIGLVEDVQYIEAKRVMPLGIFDHRIPAAVRRHLVRVRVVRPARTDRFQTSAQFPARGEAICRPDVGRVIRRIERRLALGARLLRGRDVDLRRISAIPPNTSQSGVMRPAALNSMPSVWRRPDTARCPVAPDRCCARCAFTSENGCAQRQLAVQNIPLGAELQIPILLGRRIRGPVVECIELARRVV